MASKLYMGIVISIFLSTVGLVFAETQPIAPGKTDKCPVCGMFVYKYPDWLGQIRFSTGERVYFDGAKDLFKYYFNLKRYHPGKTVKDISAIWVTEYYDLSPVKARHALFVIGSDVFGPMGKELIPFKTLEAAQEFKRDHKGTAILDFGKITPGVIKLLD